jgi:tRNA-Thr(GGU) m(6)t(6)A37 methyltransferase TsaA
MEERTFTVVEIGIAKTPLLNRREAPQQPGGFSHEAHFKKGSLATIHIHAPYRAALADLDGFERVWLLYVFDRNQGWRPTVKPPRGGGHRGLFATRGPHRPSPIGLTCARLVEVTSDSVIVDEADLLDGTPVVDIKPYLRFADAFPDARAGWVDALDDERARAEKVAEDDEPSDREDTQ